MLTTSPSITSSTLIYPSAERANFTNRQVTTDKSHYSRTSLFMQALGLNEIYTDIDIVASIEEVCRGLPFEKWTLDGLGLA